MKSIILNLAKGAVTNMLKEVFSIAIERNKLTRESYNAIVIILAEKGINLPFMKD
jgi:hypothetical protein